jgi:hypothetical protein
MPLVGIITSLFFGVNIFKARMQASGMDQAVQQAGDLGLPNMLAELSQVNWWFIVPMFLMFFIFGYFFICISDGSDR